MGGGEGGYWIQQSSHHRMIYSIYLSIACALLWGGGLGGVTECNNRVTTVWHTVWSRLLPVVAILVWWGGGGDIGEFQQWSHAVIPQIRGWILLVALMF